MNRLFDIYKKTIFLTNSSEFFKNIKKNLIFYENVYNFRNFLFIISDQNKNILFIKNKNMIFKMFNFKNFNEFQKKFKKMELFNFYDYEIGVKLIAKKIFLFNSSDYITVSMFFNKYESFNYFNIVFELIYKDIEKELEIQKIKSELIFSSKILNIMSKSIDDGFICFDKDARIMLINDAAGKMLNIFPSNAIGKHVTEIVDFDPVILSVFKTHKGYVDKEFRIESQALGIVHFVKTAIILRDKNGEFNGVLDFFRRVDRVKKFVTNYIGAKARFKFKDIIGKSKKIKEALRIAKIAAKSKSNVLISGETGTGKEVFAQAIHYEGLGKNKPFIGVNCAAIPRDLAESEFFGYESGAFTGALKSGRPGKFELADHGTIFLDEIGELPISIQIKLLRVLQSRNIYRIGGTKPIAVDVRVIAATNKNLYEEIEKHNFRKDLFYRLNVISIELPPLRERTEDISMLIDHFINLIPIKLNKTIKGYDKSFIEPLLKYNFPGNVRELENIVERAINITQKQILTGEELPDYIFKNTREKKNTNLEQLQKEYIINVFQETNGNISKTARKMNVSRPTVYKMLKKFNIK